jgi:hypothetical protein
VPRKKRKIPKVVPVKNPDGSYSSERTISVESEGLNEGRPTLIPTIIEGKRHSPREAVRRAIKSGLEYPYFASNEAATTFAARRSKTGGAAKHGFIGKRPTTISSLRRKHMPAGIGYGTGLGSLATGAMDIGLSAVSPQDEKKKKKKKGVLSTAATGATEGAGGGPIGALIGAGVGAGAGLISQNQADKETGPRPKRRRLTRALGTLRDQELSRAQALGSLSQSAFDLASSLR